MTARTARLTVDPGNPAIRVEVLDTDYEVRVSGYGRIEEILPTGFYTVRYAAADAVEEDDITLRPDMHLTLNKPPKLKFASPAPLNLTSTKHEWHQHPARELSQNETKALGTGAQLLLFVRDVNRGTDRRPDTGLSLRRLDGAAVTPLAEVMKTNENDAWAGCNLALDPGSYRLRLDLGSDQAVETIVQLCLGWQSQVFLLREGGRLEARGRLIVDLPGAAQLMTPLGQGFDPWTKVQKRVEPMAAGEDLRLAELARQALDHGWRGFHMTDLSLMLDGKWEDPLLGIYGLHLLLLAPKPDLALAERVLGRLRGILAGTCHPDVDALDLELAQRQGRLIELPPFAAPPMLRRSWAMLVAATARQPSLVPLDSLAMKIADRLWGDGAWLIWKVPEEEVDELDHIKLPLLAPKERRNGAARLVQRELAGLDFECLKDLIEAFSPNLDEKFKKLGIDEVMARANLDGAEVGLLTYLQRFLPSRRARYGVVTHDPLALGNLVEHLGLPASKVKNVAAGLVLKVALLYDSFSMSIPGDGIEAIVGLPKFLEMPDWRELPIDLPPGPAGTQHEMEELLRKQNDRSERERRRGEIDSLVTDRCPDLNSLMMFDSRPLSRVLMQAMLKLGKIIAVYYKKKFMRARPSQIAPRLRPMLEIPRHAAYPSGQALQYFLVAKALASVVRSQEIGNELFEIAQRIAENREWAGLNHASDTWAAKRIAFAIFPQVQDAYAETFQMAAREWSWADVGGCGPRALRVGRRAIVHQEIQDVSDTTSNGAPEPAQVDEIWHLREPRDKQVGINALVAWQTTRGNGVRVVLCDVGVEHRHPALACRIDLEAARDFDHTTDPYGLVLGMGRIENKLDAHGTARAGLVCAIRTMRGTSLPEDMQFIGVAPECRVIPVRISTNFELDSQIAALKYAAKVGDVILLPRFLPKDPYLLDVLREIALCVPTVCASGNDGTPQLAWPAALEETIAVGACNSRGYRSTYSQYGPELDVVAPSNDLPVENNEVIRLDAEEVRRRVQGAGQASQRSPQAGPLTREQLLDESARHRWNLDKFGELSIATTDSLGEFGYNVDPFGDYCKVMNGAGFGGTSAAAAQVTGVVALMLAANNGLIGKPEEVRRILRETSSHTYLRPEVEQSQEFGFGLVDAEGAVQRAASERMPP